MNGQHWGDVEHPRDEPHRYPHRLTDRDIDFDELARRVSANVGFAVGVVGRRPTLGRPGSVMFERMGTVEPVQMDKRVVRSIISQMEVESRESRATLVTRSGSDSDLAREEKYARLTSPETWLASAQQALDEAATAETPEGWSAAMLAWLGREVARMRDLIGDEG